MFVIIFRTVFFFSETINDFPVVVNCTTKEPVTKGSKNPLQLEFGEAVGKVNENKAQVQRTGYNVDHKNGKNRNPL